MWFIAAREPPRELPPRAEGKGAHGEGGRGGRNPHRPPPTPARPAKAHGVKGNGGAFDARREATR